MNTGQRRKNEREKGWGGEVGIFFFPTRVELRGGEYKRSYTILHCDSVTNKLHCMIVLPF